MLGWLSLLVVYQLYIHLEGEGLLLLGLGGLIYSLGVIFYGQTYPLQPRHLASVRAGGQRLSLYGHLWLRRLTSLNWYFLLLKG